MAVNEERKLLEALVVGNRDLEDLERLVGEFNLFEALGVVRQEIRHSDFLRFLLDPSQNHGLGDAFLKNLLKRVLAVGEHPGLGVVDVDVADLSDAVAERERLSIDVLVHSQSNRILLAIENKVDSGEHNDQLVRYRKALDGDGDFAAYKKVLVFLSPEADQPSDSDWIPLCYDDIVETVRNVRESRRSTLGKDVYTALQHYETMVRRHIVSESDVADLCRKLYRAHQKAFDLIFEHKPDLQSLIVDVVTELAKQGGLTLDHCSKAYIRFASIEWDKDPRQKLGSGWTRSGRILLFEVQNGEDSLRLRLIIGPGDAKFRQVIFDFAQAHKDIFRGCSSNLYPKWTTIFAHPILQAKDYEASPEEVLKHANESFGKLLKAETSLLVRALEEVFGEGPGPKGK